MDAVNVKSPPSQPNPIDADVAQWLPGCLDVGRHIFSDKGATSDEGVGADLNELLDPHHAFNDDVVFDDNVAGHIHGVGQNHMVSNLHVVGHMDVRHDEAILSDPGHHAVRGCTVDGDALSDAGSIADFNRGGLTFVFQVLRVGAHHASRKELAILTHFGVPHDGGVGAHPRSCTDVHVGADECKRLHGRVGADVRRGVDVGERGNLGRIVNHDSSLGARSRTIWANISASETNSPRT